ncbi:MAG: T9SS type A sorting domain-containing protein, partial [Bacteroidota bacterium]
IEIQYTDEIIRVGTHGRGVLEAPLTVLNPLPVEWGRFTAEAKDGWRALLHWEILSAENFSHFVIERAFDGRNFEAIGQINGTSAGGGHYTYTDVVLDHLQAYYRIRAVDLDGSYSNSVIQAVSWSKDQAGDLGLYPNPTDGLLNIEISSGGARIVEWSVVDLRGALVLRGVCSVQADARRCQIIVNDLATGTYMLQLTDGDRIEVERFVKQ